MPDEKENLADWLEDCVTLSDHQGKIREWIEQNEHLVFVYYPNGPRINVYPSVWSLVDATLKSFGMTPMCAPMWNVTLDRMEALRIVAAGERTEGRPLSFERELARRIISRGVAYEVTMWIIKLVIGNPASHASSPDYSFGKRENSKLDLTQANRIRNAVDREWKQYHDAIPPSPPRGWWKDPKWSPTFANNPVTPL